MQATLPHQALPHDALLPRPPGGNGPGIALSVLAHAGLVVALTVSVDWRTHAPEVVSAELWASVPQVAAPRAVEPPPPPPPTPAPTPVPRPVQAAPPPPPPREADIATERAERRKLEAERQRAEAEAEQKKRQLAEADAKKRAAAEQAARDEKARQAKEEEARVARQREENLRRMLSQADGPTSTTTSNSGGTGTAAQDAAPSATYAGRIVAAVRKNIVFTGAINDESSAEVEVRAAPGGSILSSRLLKGSGHKEWDEAVLRAIDKTATLPRDTDGRVPARLILVFKPREQ
jgi:colicin import membrane protein